MGGRLGLVAAGLLLVGLVACGAAAPTVTPVPTPTATLPPPTATPAPTATATNVPPTATPAPTATPTGCRLADGRTAYAAFSDIYGRWKDADALAGNTPRISLAPEIAAMQSLRREVAAINWPACASAAALDLGSGMDQVIQAYLDFLANEKSDVTVGTELNAGRATLQTFELDLAALPR